MHYEDIPALLQGHYGTPTSPFIAQQEIFGHILPRALAIIFSQGKNPESSAILNRLSVLEWPMKNSDNSMGSGEQDGQESSIRHLAARALQTPPLFEGLGKRPAFTSIQFLRAITAESLDLEELAQCSAETVLEALLTIKGLGADTVELLLLYAFNIHFIPVNTALYRIANRHEQVPEVSERDEIRDWYQSFFPEDLLSIRQIHTHLITVGRQFCTPPKALCTGCPLKDML